MAVLVFLVFLVFYNKENLISERGEFINGRGDKPNRHDILTGSNLDGTANSGGEDHTCRNWTYS